MGERPGAALAQRPLHFIVVADCSGSMAADGKMQALNVAMREVVPHLADVADQNPHARVLVRVVAFSTGAHWHLGSPTPADELVWVDLEPGGYTDLGAALTLVGAELAVPPMEARALPPVVVLVSDGMPTDDWRAGLDALLAQPWGPHTVRTAVGIGRDADHDVLRTFVGTDSGRLVSASNPEQLVRSIRWASIVASRVASTLGEPDEPWFESEVSETVW